MRQCRAVLIFVVVVAVALPLEAAGPYQLYSITPCRLIDTNDATGRYPLTIGPALQHGEVRNLPIWGQSARPCGVPAHARAVAVNVVVMSPTSGGYLILFPAGAPLPLASTINFNAGESALANGASLPLTDDPTLQLSVLAGMAGSGHWVHFALDVTGYFR